MLSPWNDLCQNTVSIEDENCAALLSACPAADSGHRRPENKALEAGWQAAMSFAEGEEGGKDREWERGGRWTWTSFRPLCPALLPRSLSCTGRQGWLPLEMRVLLLLKAMLSIVSFASKIVGAVTPISGLAPGFRSMQGCALQAPGYLKQFIVLL